MIPSLIHSNLAQGVVMFKILIFLPYIQTSALVPNALGDFSLLCKLAAWLNLKCT